MDSTEHAKIAIRRDRKSAQASVKDIQAYYDIDRGMLTYLILSDAKSKRDPGHSSAEAATYLVSAEDHTREAAVNTLAKLKDKQTVGLLCDAFEKEKNLRVKARITRALEMITDTTFRPLDFDAVVAWRRSNRNKEAYAANWASLLRA